MFHLTIPARNEAPYIQDAIRRLSRSLQDLKDNWQIIIADNGSTDLTADVINKFRLQNQEFKDRVTVVSCPEVGKGAAIKFAANTLTESDLDNAVFGFIDADLSADPDAIPGMYDRITSDKADIVIASRLLVTKTTNRSWLRTFSSRLFNLFADLVLHINIEDAQCGLKIMNKKGVAVLKECHEERWFLDIEFLARARQYKLRIVEVPVPWIEFRYPERKSQINHIKDGLEAIRAIFRVRKRLSNGGDKAND